VARLCENSDLIHSLVLYAIQSSCRQLLAAIILMHVFACHHISQA